MNYPELSICNHHFMVNAETWLPLCMKITSRRPCRVKTCLKADQCQREKIQKENEMKKLLLGMMTMMMLIMSGCGDATVINPPSITAYQFTKDSAAKFIDGSVSFYAPDSDIDTMTIVVFDSGGYEITRTTASLNFPGTTQETVFFSIDYVTYPFGAYTFGIYLTDFNGYTSNQIVGTFLVP